MFVELFDLSENDVNTALELNPVSKTLLRERANFLWNVKRHESKKAYEKVGIIGWQTTNPQTKECLVWDHSESDFEFML